MENIASLKHRIVKKTEHRPPLNEDAIEAQKKESWLGSSSKKTLKKSGASSSAMAGKGVESAKNIKDSGSSSNDEDKGGNKGGSGSGSGSSKSDW